MEEKDVTVPFFCPKNCVVADYNSYADLPRMNMFTYDLGEHFLDMLCDDSASSNYPFSNDRYRSYFRHTLWMIPGVKEGLAKQRMLDKHPVFGHGNFNIANVAGD